MFFKKIQGEIKTERNKKTDSSEVMIPPRKATYITYLPTYPLCVFVPITF